METRLVLCVVLLVAALHAAFPNPFHRRLDIQDPPLEGKDVLILQRLLLRPLPSLAVPIHGQFDNETSRAVRYYKSTIKHCGEDPGFDACTAQQLLKDGLYDGYKDSGVMPAWAKYKIYIPVYRNRSVEVIAKLYDQHHHCIRNFTVLAHGQNDASGKAINQLSRDGSTPSGLMAIDLQTKEPDPKDFGPYPINRAIYGLAGNAFAIPGIRSGILVHTGCWCETEKRVDSDEDWCPCKQPAVIPNSHGCVHAWPEDINGIYHQLVEMGVEVRPNSFGKQPYPYQPQGIMSIECVDC